MFTMQGFGLMLLNFLRIPPGTSLRKHYGTNNNGSSWAEEALYNNEYIRTIVDITADDVCIGNSPYYYKCKADTPSEVRDNVESILNEFNSIAKWAAVDILRRGFSVYRTEVKEVKGKKKFLLIPVQENLDFYMTDTKEIAVYYSEDVEDKTREDKDKNLENILCFLFYEKDGLQTVKDSEDSRLRNDATLLYKINPTGIQLRNVRQTALDLATTERALIMYRKQLSRIVRFVNVDIGVSQGDKQQEIVDSVGEAVNANSISLIPMSATGDDFDDNIPIIPNRNGVGRPEIVTDVPQYEMNDLGDLQYQLSKFFLVTRFPKSYADFSQPLDQTTVSLIRGDVRYSRMITTARSLLNDVANDFLHENAELKNWEVTFSLTELPTPEDEDVVAAIDSYGTLLGDIYGLVVTDSETALEAAAKLKMLQDLLGGSSNLKSLQEWFTDFNMAIKAKFSPAEVPEGALEPEGGGDEFAGNTESPSGDFESEVPEGALEADEDSGYAVEYESIPPGTNE